MLYLGCHLSSSAGFKAMGETAIKLNANTFQFFLRNPRGGAAKDINPDDVKAFLKLAVLMFMMHFSPVMRAWKKP